MQDHLVDDTWRNVVRALIVSGVFAAVIALIGRCKPVVMIRLSLSFTTPGAACCNYVRNRYTEPPHEGQCGLNAVVTYVTDDSVRGSAVIVREDNVDKLSQVGPAAAVQTAEISVITEACFTLPGVHAT